MTIRVWDYLREYQEEREEILRRVDQVFLSGRLILGDQVRNFEEAFAAFCGVSAGVGVGNGTDAIFLALRALGIGPGDEVITVSNTAVPTVAAIVAAGAAPRFVDIERDTYLVDVGRIEDAITPRTKCVLPVHLFGQCAHMEALLEIADRKGIAVLEDCSQAHGAARHGKRAGAFGRAATFSFYPTKPLGTYGDGGMIVTDDPGLAQKLRQLRFYGMKQQYFALESGYNSRLDEVHAAILAFKLERLDHYLARRREIAMRYDDMLADTPLQLPVTSTGNEHAYYLYVVRHAERDRILEQLRSRGIDLNISYPWPIHTMPPYSNPAYQAGSLAETESAAREIFSLPMYPTLLDEEQLTVCTALQEICGKLR